jgi:hypothetical protein
LHRGRLEIGGMTNAELILTTLDRHLTVPVELTLYGRAALQLGFPDAPAEYAQSLDVDGVLWMGQAEELLQHSNFWQAVAAVNAALAPQGLYISHFFEETQLILTPGWRTQRQSLPPLGAKLRLFRLGNADLFLTKLMRYDPQDLQDARFIAERTGWTTAELQRLLHQAQLPDIPEIREQFALCAKHFS